MKGLGAVLARACRLPLLGASVRISSLGFRAEGLGFSLGFGV